MDHIVDCKPNEHDYAYRLDYTYFPAEDDHEGYHRHHHWEAADNREQRVYGIPGGEQKHKVSKHQGDYRTLEGVFNQTFDCVNEWPLGIGSLDSIAKWSRCLLVKVIHELFPGKIVFFFVQDRDVFLNSCNRWDFWILDFPINKAVLIVIVVDNALTPI